MNQRMIRHNMKRKWYPMSQHKCMSGQLTLYTVVERLLLKVDAIGSKTVLSVVQYARYWYWQWESLNHIKESWTVSRFTSQKNTSYCARAGQLWCDSQRFGAKVYASIDVNFEVHQDWSTWRWYSLILCKWQWCSSPYPGTNTRQSNTVSHFMSPRRASCVYLRFNKSNAYTVT